MKKISVLAGLVWLMASAALVSAQTQTQNEELKVAGPPNSTVSFQPLEEGKVLVSVSDAQSKPIFGLKPENFLVRRGIKTAKVLSVEPLATSKDVPLQIVLVVDNSFSMKERKAIKPLLGALDAFYKKLRPIDRVTAVVFDERGTMMVAGRPVNAKILQTSDVGALRQFINEGFAKGLTEGTYLYDAMQAGLDAASRMKGNKFLVVFSDGEDLNSKVKPEQVKKAAAAVDGLTVLAVDYMPQSGLNPFLNQISAANSGRAMKATSAEEILPVFEAFSSIMLHRYVVTYRYLNPPKGSIALAPAKLTIEEITTIDSSPLLNHIYFSTGESELPNRYILFEDSTEITRFDEKNLKGPMEKYRQVLNVVGSRLKRHPKAAVRLVGCNSGTGEEKGRIDLSRSRAEAVRSYLHYIWGIDLQRMTIDARNLPAAPSASRLPEGQAENQRVEILSDNDAILDTVNSAFVQKVCDTKQVQVLPRVESEAGIAEWAILLACGTKKIKEFSGKGTPPQELTLPLDDTLIEEIAACREIAPDFKAVDKEANVLSGFEGTALGVNYVQRSRQAAEIQEYKVKEQYALILFDFNSSDVKERNKIIVDRIINRIAKVPDPTIAIVGHTDTIGSEEYNLKLSDKRAKAVFASMGEALAGMGDGLQVIGVGPNAPLYDNSLPEGRSLNRTVTVTLEYLRKDEKAQ